MKHSESMQNSSKANCFKAEIPEKHYKADRTLRVRVADLLICNEYCSQN